MIRSSSMVFSPSICFLRLVLMLTRLAVIKVLYDYAATIEEEFDFQAEDVIAVTSTLEDGWWTGELLDEARRQPVRNVFPSNFVCLFLVLFVSTFLFFLS